MLDLFLPLECGACASPGTRWCAACASELDLGPDAPHLISPRVDPGVPVFALGRYAGARRQAIVAVKERGRADLIAPLGAALVAGLGQLLSWGLLDAPLMVVPAPTRRSAARRRGGDPVTRMTRVAAAQLTGVAVVPALRMTALVRDSVGLDSAARQRNVAGRVVPRRRRLPVGGEVLLVDDIITTGATAAESVRVLRAVDTPVAAVLVIGYA